MDLNSVQFILYTVFNNWGFFLILSYSILFFLFLSYSLLFYLILSYSILFYLIISYSTVSYSILFFLILSYSFLFFLILSYSLVSLSSSLCNSVSDILNEFFSLLVGPLTAFPFSLSALFLLFPFFHTIWLIIFPPSLCFSLSAFFLFSCFFLSLSSFFFPISLSLCRFSSSLLLLPPSTCWCHCFSFPFPIALLLFSPSRYLFLSPY